MDKELKRKIRKIERLLRNQSVIKAVDFDKNYDEAKILSDPRGARWNQWLKDNYAKYGFEIWKDRSRKNYYVRATKAGRAMAQQQGLFCVYS